MISVLCVDNEPALREECRQFLGRGGDMSVDPAGSGSEALGLLAGRQYDAVVSAHRPGLDGIALVTKLREGGNPVPFVLFAEEREELVTGALERGADFFLPVRGEPKEHYATLRAMVLAAIRRKKAEEALRATGDSLRLAARKQATISSATRHDVNNKLTIVSGYTQLIRLENPGERVAEYIEIMERAVSDISKLLKFSKEYEKIGAAPPAWQDLAAVIAKAVAEIDFGPAHFSNDIAGVKVMADPLLCRVFTNLAANALMHGGEITSIRVHSEHRGPDLFLIFEDNGKGIPAELKERIFNRGAGKNTGLGLNFSREILAVTGFEIREKGEPGHGARFEIRMPAGTFSTD